MPLSKPLTGRGITTRVGTELTDLGIARWDADRQAIAVMFGDSFSTEFGRDWRSPVIVMYDKDLNVLGIPTKGGIAADGMARQLWEYGHNNPDYSTILPCDFIRVKGIWYVAVMVTQGLGNEKVTEFWCSEDLVDWKPTDPFVQQWHPSHPGNVMLTFDQVGRWVYIFGTGGLARNRPIWLWRNRADEFPHGWWEPWGRIGSEWEWGNPNEHSPIIQGRYGELCFRHIQGNSVLSFFDAAGYRQTALTAVHPVEFHDGALVNRVDYAHGNQFPQLYGGYISPVSRLNEPNGMDFLVSQWNTATNHPYHVLAFQDTLIAKGPLQPDDPTPAKPTPEVPVEPETPEEPVTPQELYEQLLRELSASGSTPILTTDGRSLTLREAVSDIYRELCFPDDLKGRPEHPSTPNDLVGQVLNSRAEGLFTQALVVAIADKFGINAAAIYEQVQGAFR